MAKLNLVVIRLRDDEYAQLEGIAAREERDPYAQARYVMRRYLTQEAPVNPQPAQYPPDAEHSQAVAR